jgi:hypothetical protein
MDRSELSDEALSSVIVRDSGADMISALSFDLWDPQDDPQSH